MAYTRRSCKNCKTYDSFPRVFGLCSACLVPLVFGFGLGVLVGIGVATVLRWLVF